MGPNVDSFVVNANDRDQRTIKAANRPVLGHYSFLPHVIWYRRAGNRLLLPGFALTIHLRYICSKALALPLYPKFGGEQTKEY